MQKERKRIIEDIIKFLGFFNYHLPVKSYYDLINDLFYYKKTDILDSEDNVVGIVIKNEESILIQVKNDNKYLESILITRNKNNKEFRKAYFFVTDKNNKSLKGNIEFIRSQKTENLFFEGKYHIFNGKIEVARSKFATYNNMVNLTDTLSEEFINYSSKKENNFKQSKMFHRKKDITMDVVCDLDNIYYKRRKLVEEIRFSDDEYIVDNRYSYGGYLLNNSGEDKGYDVLEKEISKVYQENDPEVFEFIENQKNLLNYFGDNLFEKIFSSILFNLGKKSLMNILGIDDTYKGISYKK